MLGALLALARPDLDGFSLTGSRSTPCLLLHGFTATPMEVRPLAETLAASGFAVHAPRLPGHGTTVEDLGASGARVWIAAAEEALAKMPGPALVAGQSMGGLLALVLAARHPDRVRAVATLAAPLWFGDRRARVLVPLLRWTPLRFVLRSLPKAPSAIPEERRREHFTYDRFPVRGLFGLASMMRIAWKAVPRVTAPLLVVHGQLDVTAPPLSARRIIARAASASKTLVELKGSRHVLTMDVEREIVCRTVEEFFVRHAA